MESESIRRQEVLLVNTSSVSHVTYLSIMEEYQHSLFFEAKDLTDREKDKIRRHFQRRRDSGGGECGDVERVGRSSYRIDFQDKEDQERVLQRKLHRILLPGGEIQLTVRRTQSSIQPSDSFSPQTSTVSINRDVLERRIQVAPFLLKYLLDSQKAFRILQKKLSAVDCAVVLDFTEKTAVIRKNIQSRTAGAALVADAATWSGQVDKVFHGLIESYVCHPVVEPRMIQLLSQDTSIVRDDVRVYFEASDVVLVGETDAVKEKVAHLMKSLPAQKKVYILEHQFKVVEEQLNREMKVQCPGVEIVRCTESNSVVLEGNDEDVESGAKLLQEMIQRIKARRLRLSESLWDFLVFSGAVLKYQAVFLSNLSSPVFIEAGSSILLSSLSPAAMDEAEAVLKREVSEATFTVQGAAAEPANVERLKGILEKAEDAANSKDIRVMVNFCPALGPLSEVRLVGYSTNVKNLQEVLQDFQRTKVHTQEEVKLSHPEMVHCFSDIFNMTGLDKTNLTLQASSYPYPRALLSGPYHLVKDTKKALTLSLANITFDALVFDSPGAQQYFSGAGKDSKTLVETSCRVLIRAQETASPEPRPRQTRSQNLSSVGASVFSFGSLSSHTHTVESLNRTKPSLEITLGSIVDEEVNVMVVPMNNRTLTSTKIGQCLLTKAGQMIKSKFDLTAAGCGSAAGSVMQINAPALLRCSKIFFIECVRWDGASGHSVKGLAQGLRNCLDLCAQQGFSSVSFPLIGPGILLQYPVKEAVKVLAQTIRRFDSQSTSKCLSTVRIVLAADYPDSVECYQTVYKHFSEKTGRGAGIRSVSGDLDDVTFAVGGGPKLQLIFGDITNETTDAVVQINHNVADSLIRGDICETWSTSILGKPVLRVHEEHDTRGIEDLMKKIIHRCEAHGYRSVAIPCICSDERQLDSATSARAMLQGVQIATSATPLTSLTNIRIILVKINDFLVFKKEATQMFSSGIINQGAQSQKHPVHMPQSGLSSPSNLSSLWSGSQSPRSTFFFFGLSRDSVASAKLKLKSLHDTQFSRQEFKKSEFEFLTMEEAEELKEIAKSSGLHFELGSTGHDVVVSGLKDSVGKVMQLLNVSLRRKVTVKEEADLFNTVAWCIQENDGNWQRLPKTANHKLENKDIQDLMEDAQGNKWMMDLSKMEARGQFLTAKLKRLENLPDFTLPLYWDDMEAEKDLAMVILDPASAEYRRVENGFKQTCWGSIIKITRVQNVHLRRAYEVQKRRISEKNGDAGEKLLYHGTSQDSCHSIMKNGFNRSYAGQNGTSYGQGCYFAVNANYSSSYAKPKTNGSKLMLVARVLAGIYTVGHSTMKVPPPRNPRQPNELYDSLVDSQHQPSLFVVFHDNQAYPDYLIHFQ
ncbi:protein mono-ADP-ribosyltransferase PARP14-like isoform 2-T2 [Synchiropus picturatus]